MTYSVEITGNKLEERLTREWSDLAGEKIEINASITSNPIIAYGSEIACLRLFYKFNHSDKPSPIFTEDYVRFSENLKTWYFIKYPSADFVKE